MSVSLVWITPEAEKIVSYCARVSNPANQNNQATASKLLQYCAKHSHWSVFEMASMCVEINTTRAISAQILRHKSLHFQEFCVAEGTLITCKDQDGTTKYLPIEVCYEYQFEKRLIGFSPTMVKVYDEENKQFVWTNCKEVFNTGQKECYKLTLEDGKTITSTEDHKYFTTSGFKPLKEYNVGDLLMVYNTENGDEKSGEKGLFQSILSIENVGVKMTYDIEVEHKSHNYVANGIVTHNSQRYAEALDYDLPVFRHQDTKNRQNSFDTVSEEEQIKLQERSKELMDQSFALYHEMVKSGIAKESARFILPLCTETRMYVSGTLRSWIHYIQLRTDPSTQKEHREIANEVKEILCKECPSLICLFEM